MQCLAFGQSAEISGCLYVIPAGRFIFYIILVWENVRSGRSCILNKTMFYLATRFIFLVAKCALEKTEIWSVDFKVSEMRTVCIIVQPSCGFILSVLQCTIKFRFMGRVIQRSSISIWVLVCIDSHCTGLIPVLLFLPTRKYPTELCSWEGESWGWAGRGKQGGIPKQTKENV